MIRLHLRSDFFNTHEDEDDFIGKKVASIHECFHYRSSVDLSRLITHTQLRITKFIKVFIIAIDRDLKAKAYKFNTLNIR